MASTVWKGTLEFGMLSVPVKLEAAARAEKTSFKRVNPATGAGTKQLNVDAKTGEVVKSGDLVKSTVHDGRLVYVTDQEIKSLLASRENLIDLVEFVKLSDVDPVYFATSYNVIPDPDHPSGAYELLHRALGTSKAAGIGKMVRLNRDYLVLVRATEQGLRLHTLFYGHEVRSGHGETPAAVSDRELRLARKFIRARLNPWEPSKYRDEFALALQGLLESKTEQKPTAVAATLKTAIKRAKAQKAGEQ